MEAQDDSAACAVAEHAFGQSGYQPNHDSTGTHEQQVEEAQASDDAHVVARHGCQQPEEQPEVHSSGLIHEEQLTEGLGSSCAHMPAEHGCKSSAERAGLHSSSNVSEQKAELHDLAEHECDSQHKQIEVHSSRSADGERVARAEEDTAAYVVAEHGNDHLEEQHDLQSNSLAQEQMIDSQESDAARMVPEHHCKESQEQLPLHSSIAAHQQQAAAGHRSPPESSAAHADYEHTCLQSEEHLKLHRGIPAQTPASAQSKPTLTESQTAEHRSLQAQHRAELKGVDFSEGGAGNVQHSNCATRPPCKGSRQSQHKDGLGTPCEFHCNCQKCGTETWATRCFGLNALSAACSGSPCDCLPRYAAPQRDSGTCWNALTDAGRGRMHRACPRE